MAIKGLKSTSTIKLTPQRGQGATNRLSMVVKAIQYHIFLETSGQIQLEITTIILITICPSICPWFLQPACQTKLVSCCSVHWWDCQSCHPQSCWNQRSVRSKFLHCDKIQVMLKSTLGYWIQSALGFPRSPSGY